MEINQKTSRLLKLFLDEGLSFTEAQTRLSGLTLEIAVGPDAISPTAHAAILTAVSVGLRSFPGGVQITGATEQPLNSCLPLPGKSLAEAASYLGATPLDFPPARRLAVGSIQADAAFWTVSPWWDGWSAAARPGQTISGTSDNPLVGIAAGALAIGAAFESARGRNDPWCEANLWPTEQGQVPPSFSEVYLPGALWLIGLGNLGQAYLWALTSLPYANPKGVSLVLQDRDTVSSENWSTSVLVREDNVGELKTKVGERWAQASNFDVRRIDKYLLENDRRSMGDPLIALSGVDSIHARKSMAKMGFDCIVDAGLGHNLLDVNHYRITVFDKAHPIDVHFKGEEDKKRDQDILAQGYQGLEAKVGRCGMAEIAGASVAVPYVSALTATIAIARLIAITSNCPCPYAEKGRIFSDSRISPLTTIPARGMSHAGRPNIAQST